MDDHPQTVMGKRAGSDVLRSRGLWIALGISTLISLSALRVDWVNDDVMHHATLTKTIPAIERELDEVYCFVGGPKNYP